MTEPRSLRARAEAAAKDIGQCGFSLGCYDNRDEIADAIDEHLRPVGVGVVLECRHMCMESRGVCQQGHTTITSALRGALLHDGTCRAEFMALCRGTRT